MRITRPSVVKWLKSLPKNFKFNLNDRCGCVFGMYSNKEIAKTHEELALIDWRDKNTCDLNEITLGSGGEFLTYPVPKWAIELQTRLMTNIEDPDFDYEDYGKSPVAIRKNKEGIYTARQVLKELATIK